MLKQLLETNIDFYSNYAKWIEAWVEDYQLVPYQFTYDEVTVEKVYTSRTEPGEYDQGLGLFELVLNIQTPNENQYVKYEFYISSYGDNDVHYQKDEYSEYDPLLHFYFVVPSERKIIVWEKVK